MNRSRTTTSRPHGTAYVLVLAISMLVAIIGAAAVSIVRVQLQMTTMSSDSEEARSYAQSGMELVKQWTYANPTWRTDGTKPAGANGAVAIGTGSFTVAYSDPVDGNIANSPLDNLVVTVTGYKGRSQQQVQCTLAPVPVVYSSVRSAITTGGNLSITAGDLIVSGAGIASNGNISLASGRTIDGDCSAAGTCTGTSYFGAKISGAAPRVLPGASAFDYYIANGTMLNYAAIGGKLKDITLSPTNNPYGTPNPKGIYVVDCGGQTIYLKTLNVTGTIVLLNVKSDSWIDDKVVLTNATPGLPALMVQGSITHLGDKNITGLVYVSGNFWNQDHTLTINGGLIVGGAIGSNQDLTVNWDGSYVTNPPPGFFDPPPMKTASGSIKQTVN